MSNKFKDSEKTITIPSVLVFTDNLGDEYEVQSDDIEFDEVRVEDSQEIVAINMRTEIENCGTVTNNVIFNSDVDHIRREIVSKASSDTGYYNEDPNNSYEDRSYDSDLILSKDTLSKIKVKHR